MKIGILGFGGSGKTAVFETLVSVADAEMKKMVRPEDRHKAHTGVVQIRDARLTELAKVFQPKKTTFAEIMFMDTPGFDMVHARDADGLAVVIGAFMGKNPAKELKDIDLELTVSDLSIVQNRLKRLEKEMQAARSETSKIEHDLLMRCEKTLGTDLPLRTLSLNEQELNLLHGFQFLTIKPALAILNIHENELGKEPPQEFIRFTEERRIGMIEFCAAIENEIQELEESERPAFLESLGIDKPAKDKLIQASCAMMKSVFFFTVKGDEVRAWPVQETTTAIDAAGKIHTDIKRGFIRAEVVNYKDFAACGFSMQEARKRALLRLEGKEYVVKDGDIVDFRFSV